MRFLGRTFSVLALIAAMLFPAGVASADPAEIIRFDRVFFVVNSCLNSERVGVESTFKIVVKRQNDGTLITHTILQGQGTGTRGSEYVLSFNQRQREMPTGDLILKRRIALIGKGSVPNQFGTLTIDTTEGVFTFEEDCRG